jgi:hypothetical protein
MRREESVRVLQSKAARVSNLLEVGRESVEILVVRKNGNSLEFVEVVVPDSDRGKDCGHVLFERRVSGLSKDLG